MKCPKCGRRRIRKLAAWSYKCRKCRHTWEAIKVKVEPEE